MRNLCAMPTTLAAPARRSGRATMNTNRPGTHLFLPLIRLVGWFSGLAARVEYASRTDPAGELDESMATW